jgi:hypothetical protein
MNLFEQQSTLESISSSKARVPIVDIFACGIGVQSSSLLFLPPCPPRELVEPMEGGREEKEKEKERKRKRKGTGKRKKK